MTIRGNADHSGATPMNLRHDALCGASKIILGIEEIAAMQEEPPVVGTVGIVEVTPGGDERHSWRGETRCRYP